MKSEVNCPECGTHCGWWYEATWEYPSEYAGEDNYLDTNGVPYCSVECLEESKCES